MVFIVLRIVPGDPALELAGDSADSQQIELIRRQLGLDHPLGAQYLLYLGHLFTGDLGQSFRTRQPVLSGLMSQVLATVELVGAAMALTVVIGIAAGAYAAYRRGRAGDVVLLTGSGIGLALPSFWLGLLLVWVFAVNLRLLPASGGDSASAVILPAVSLALGSIAITARTLRSTMVETLNQGYIRTARSKGLSERRVVFRHALRNALIPTTTLMGLNFGYLLGTAVLIETVFAWPGLGSLLLRAVQDRDFPVIQGATIAFAVLFLLANLVVDVLNVAVDPRLRRG